MLLEELPGVRVEQAAIASGFLKHYVIADLYIPEIITGPSGISLLLINDGQDLEEMKFAAMLSRLQLSGRVKPLLCVGIHAGKNRKMEYGTADVPDHAGRGARARAYQQFVLQELIPFIQKHTGIGIFEDIGYCGFSLGGLTAFDTVWSHPGLFSQAGVFSGSLWWRSKELGPDYDDDSHRIMHQIVRHSDFRPGLRFFFTTGSQDEICDRNNNGIIDSIDDTQALMKELVKLGYRDGHDLQYINYEDGKHDVATWGRAMPAFLLWGWPLRAAMPFEAPHDY